MSRWEEAGPATRTPQRSSRNKCWSTTSEFIRGNSRRISNILFGGEDLLGQFRAEFLLFVSHEFPVAVRIYERVRRPVFHVRIFFFQPEITPMRSQKNIARQNLQTVKQPQVIR